MRHPLAALVLVAALVALPSVARAQGFVNVAAAGGIDGRGAPTFDARVGLLSHLQLQAAVTVAPLGATHDDAGAQDYTLVAGSLGIMPYLQVGSVGLAVHAALGAGGVLGPTIGDNSRDTKFAFVAELGPSLHLWPSRVFGIEIALDYRILHVVQPWAGFPENANDFVARVWLEIALPER